MRLSRVQKVDVAGTTGIGRWLQEVGKPKSVFLVDVLETQLDFGSMARLLHIYSRKLP